MNNMDNRSNDPWKRDLFLECDWCGYNIPGDELVKTLKGPMHWFCSQEAQLRGCFKQEEKETLWLS